MLLVQVYLRTHSLEQLEEEHGVRSRVSNDLTKVSLNYDQFTAVPGDKLAEECRGLVLRPLKTLAERDIRTRIVGATKVLAHPMNRFYNHDDIHAADVNWLDPELKLYEKLDGTMVVLYWDELKATWFVATRAVPEADVAIGGPLHGTNPTTFSGLFWTTLEKMYGEHVGENDYDFLGWFDATFDKNTTYVFELTTPLNRVVVRYDGWTITLIAARDLRTKKELKIDDVALLFVPKPRTWQLSSLKEAKGFVDGKDPTTLEGLVACDSHFNRIKLKNKDWELAQRLKSGSTCSPRNMLDAVLDGKVDELNDLIDARTLDVLARLQDGVDEYVKRIDANFSNWCAEAAGSKKRFAELVLTSGEWSTPYFRLSSGRFGSAREALTLTRTRSFVDALLEQLACDD